MLGERFEKCKELLQKGNSAVDASFKDGVRQFLKWDRTSKSKYTTNDALYEMRLAHAGFYTLASFRKNENAMQIYRDLRRLWHIEECFREMKINLDTRLVYVWTPSRICGHFLVCYLALVMERLACYQAHKAGVELSARRVIEVLSEAKMSILEQDKTKTTLYWRQGVSANAQKNNTYADELDALFRVAGLEPPSCISSAWS